MTYRPSLTIMLLWLFWLCLAARTLGVFLWTTYLPEYSEPHVFFFDYRS